MTSRLYYDDPYSREFDATIVRVEPREGGQAVWLDRSSFYPTSGGQPFDTGTLGPFSVVDVSDEDGEVVHLVRDGSLAAGAAVHGVIDWPRRFDHMQQHTGQHVLSAAFVHTAGVPTVSFHLGTGISTIDLARDCSTEAISAAEDEANRVVWEDRAVSIRYAEADDARNMGLRKPQTRSGTLRLIDIDGHDLSACGGSHVSRTGAVGIVAVTGWERFKGGIRVEFVCGGRALHRHRLLRDTVTRSVRQLSVLPQDLPAAIERLQADQRQQTRTIAERDEALAGCRARELAGTAEQIGGFGIVVRAIESDAVGLKSLAAAICATPRRVAVLISTASPSAIVAMRSLEAGVRCDTVVRSTCERFGGRGGGKPDLAQGGGLSGPSDAIAEHAREAVIAFLA